MRIFRNIKSILIGRIFRRDVNKMSSKSTIETTTRIANICRLTLNNSNTLIMRFRNSCQLTHKIQ